MHATISLGGGVARTAVGGFLVQRDAMRVDQVRMKSPLGIKRGQS